MATITIAIGANTVTRTAGNAIAAELIGDFIAANGGPVTGTPQEQLDWFIKEWIFMVRESSNNYRKRLVSEQAVTTANIDARNWK